MRRMLVLLSLLCLLSACGEGGDSASGSNSLDSGAATANTGNIGTGGSASANTPPLADGGPNRSVIVNQPVTLTGGNSRDVDGDQLTHAWAMLAKPGGSAAALTTAAAATAAFVPDLPGSYVLELTVSDGRLASTARVEVTAYPDPSPFFSTTRSAARVLLNDWAQPGSVFTSSVSNLTGHNFRLDRYELVNGYGVVSSTSDPIYLNNNVLPARTTLTLEAILNLARPNNGFKSIFYLTDTTSGQQYIAIADYN